MRQPQRDRLPLLGSEYVPTPDTTPALSTQPQKFAPRGAAAAHLDLPRGRLVPHP